MTFLIVTHVPHTYFKGALYAYGPYVKEMNLWLKYADKILVLAPLSLNEIPGEIDLKYDHPAIEFIRAHEFNLVGISSVFKTLVVIPSIIGQCFGAFKRADHVHLRCPGNMGLLGCITQVFFPSKTKTAKYAGNWDRHSKQPWSYKLQRRILNSTFLTKNMRALVYGNWPGNTKNILPFFTASYKETDRTALSQRIFNGAIKLIFVGSLTRGKQPMISCQVVKALISKGIAVSLDMYGEGPERKPLEKFIMENRLEEIIMLHGNQNSGVVKAGYQQAHFLVFISESEGWPKAVAEAMWWRCLPITTAVSCVPEMLGYGKRGDLVTADVAEVAARIEYYSGHSQEYGQKCSAAMEWSRQYTLECFENEIKGLMQS